MTVITVLLAVLITETDVPSTEPVDEVRAAVQRWIEQLEAPTLAERFRAERELLDLGPKILPWLPAKELLPGANSREAVPRIRHLLQKQLAHDSVKPTQVNLSGNLTLAELVAEITKQTGNRLRLAKDLPASLTESRIGKFEQATFWETIDTLTEKLPLRAVSHPDSDELFLEVRPAETPPPVFSRNGVLQVELAQVTRHEIIGDASRKLIRLQGELAFEPRLRPLFVHFRAGEFFAITNQDLRLDNWNPGARYELPMAGASRRTKIQWDFVTMADAIPQTVALQGKLLVQLAAATEQIRFDQLATRQEILRRRGGVSVRMHQAEFTDGPNGTRSAKVRVTVSYETGGPAFESHRTWVYHNAAWLEDPHRRYPLTDFDTLQQTDGNVQLEYRFDNLPPDEALKFVYEAPTLLLDVPFDIIFPQVAVEVEKR